MGKIILLTGLPGSGKTTIVERALGLLTDLRPGGFITREMRSPTGERLGFEIRTLDGESAVLAHIRLESPYRVGKYGVDVRALEQTGVAAIHRAIQAADFVVVDEIGKMELLSPTFREAIQAAIRSPKPVLATIMLRSHPFADALKKTPAAERRLVTRETRDALPAWVADCIRRALSARAR